MGPLPLRGFASGASDRADCALIRVTAGRPCPLPIACVVRFRSAPTRSPGARLRKATRFALLTPGRRPLRWSWWRMPDFVGPLLATPAGMPVGRRGLFSQVGGPCACPCGDARPPVGPRRRLSLGCPSIRPLAGDSPRGGLAQWMLGHWSTQRRAPPMDLLARPQGIGFVLPTRG